MAGFVAQVWVLCAVAFLLGSGVTWLLFVRPQRRADPVVAPPAGVPATQPAPAAPRPEPTPEDPAAPASDPALTALDTPPLGGPRTPGTGARASSTLDLLGVTPSGLAPPIPTQHGPADEDDGPRS